MHNFFSFFYVYMVVALWLGDLWEALGAVAVSALAAAWLMLYLLRGWGGPFWLYGWPRPLPDWGGWLLYVATALALVGVVHNPRRPGRRVAREAAAPMISSDLENPILIVQGHAQILQGGVVVIEEQHRYNHLLLFSCYWTACWQCATGRDHLRSREMALDLLDALS
jgi:hypothetical protein